MYHIKADKRSLASARLISQGLNRLLQAKDFDSITVTDIVNEAGVGRATFCRLFDNVTDVITYSYYIIAHPTLEKIQNKFISNILDFSKSLINDFYSQDSILLISTLLFSVQNGYHFLSMLNLYKNDLLVLLKNEKNLKTKSQDYKYLMEIYLMTLMVTVGSYIQKPEITRELLLEKVSNVWQDLTHLHINN
ncbi:TetR family transcriptional regulator [Streptococcus pneumoniae]|uniref:TetR family transcriptional regulator n=1 Tax=Streptococcus pneumoniae TaxID=1313 RepID=UPI0005E8216A|nr:TetR family transcriptional regulator [Streptococcus pneumoniae]CTO60987.1 hypothetical protein ERS044029_00367 [Streptococcus pneumoniae]